MTIGKTLIQGVGLAVLICLSGVLGFAVVRWGGHFALPLLPSGLAVAALYRWGIRLWPALAVSGFAIDVLVGQPWLPAIGTGAGLTLGALLTVRLLKLNTFNPDFSTARDVLVFLSCAATGMALAPLVGSLSYWLAGVSASPSYIDSGVRWYTSTTVGVYLFAPALLAMRRDSFSRLLQHPLESAGWMLGILATATVIAVAPGPTGRSAIVVLSLLLVVVGTIRYGFVASALGALAISGTSAASLTFGFGMFGVFDELAGRLTLMSFTGTLTALTLTVHALLEERDAAAAKRLAAERQYAEIFDGSPQPIWVHEPSSLRFLLINAAARRQYGWGGENGLAHSVHTLQVPGGHGPLRPAVDATAARDSVVEPYETRHLTRDGRIIEVEVWTRSLDLGGRAAELVFAIDVTERRALGRALIDSISGEQRRIALEMHDGLGQEMTGLGLSLRALATRAQRDGDAIAQDLDQLAKLSAHCVESARHIVQGLAPLNDAGGSLEKALELLARRSSTETTAVRLSLPQQDATALEPDALNHLYRIAQEAMQNALAHANARTIDIELSSGATGVLLSVVDDGVGVATEGVRRLGHGLRTMQFRAGAIGGTLVIEARQSGGTAVLCRAPAPQSSNSLPRETRHQPFTARE